MSEVRVLLFAGVKEAAGVEEILVARTPGLTIRGALEKVAEMYMQISEHIEAVFNSSILVTMNLEYTNDFEQAVPEGAEIAIIPPVSGG
jgi:molybdopterin converting factor small subunit